MAEVLIERGMIEGELKGKQETLLRLLKKKFSKLPAAIEAQVRARKDGTKLDAWADEILTANNRVVRVSVGM
jgi:hypothetical protein